jgi:two-component system cell cycle sensor histidine kinase PleC
MSHELKTPLNAIIGFAELMEQRLFGALGSDRYEEYVADIKASGNGLLAIINDILEMSRIEAGKVSLEPARIDVAQLIDATASAVKAEADAKAIRLAISAGPGASLFADNRVLRHALTQLLRNAVKFTPEGGAVCIRARRSARCVNIFVADNGIGIAPENLERFGKPFEVLSNTLRNGNKGSGLGAAIARSLVEMHGGQIRVRSAPGVGTIVMASLPLNPGLH